MKIVIAKNSGFCLGVDKAVKTALLQPAGSVTFGEIIHNSQVVDKLSKCGITSTLTMDECRGKNVVIRTHGISQADENQLREVAANVVDATCPFVKRIHDIVRQNYDLGRQIVIIGEKQHPEVVGTNGWCDNSACIVSSIEDAQSLKNCTKSLVIVCQTTFSLEKAKKIAEFIKNSCKIVEFFNTICYTTKDRQCEARELARFSDGMLVIGDRNSSNTMKLYEICQSECDNTYLITCVDDLECVVNKNFQQLGITAGASTPNELIEEVANIMSESQNNEMNVEAVEAKTEESFAELFEAQETMVRVKAGQKQEVIVIRADKDGINVNFGGKADGIIAANEVEINAADYNPNDYTPGMSFVAEFIDGKSNDGVFAMSKKRIAEREQEAKECEEILKGGDFTIKIDKAVKGGLISKLGPYTIFVPQSHIKLGFEKNPEKYEGKEMKLRMIPAKKDENTEAAVQDGEQKLSKRIVASHKIILEEEKMAREDEFWDNMIENEVVTGKVKRFTTFGAFVSVNSFDCLAHISDLSWVKITDPSEVLETNKSYEFLVLKADRGTGKVSLGYKQLQKKPYEEAKDKYPIGMIVKGTVERIYPYGAFVTIEKGIDGLVPVSEISHSYVKDAAEAFTVGQEVEAQIIKFDGTKITLSIKALIAPPEKVEDMVLSDDDIQGAKEKRAKANARKYDANQVSSPRKPRAKKSDSVRDEIKSWTSETSTATFADLFKGLNFEVGDSNTDEENK